MNVVKNEPVVSAAAVAGIIVALASLLHVGLDIGTVQTVVVAVLPVILSIFARAKVTPVAKS